VPLTAIQLLWVNIIADGPPAVTLGVDPPAGEVMDRSPRRPDAPIVDVSRVSTMVLAALTMAVGTIGVFRFAESSYDPATAQTLAFSTFVLFQMFNVLNVRSENRSVFSRYTLTNGKLWLAIGAVVVLQVLAVGWPPLASVFDTEPLSAGQWSTAFAVASSVVVVEELRKLVVRLRARRGAVGDHLAR
jgi:Ca2+-transporting ATPase